MTTFATLESGVRQALYDILYPALVANGPANVIYKYRTDGGSRLSRTVVITTMNIEPAGETSGGPGGTLDVGFIILVDYDESEQSKEAAEDDLGAITGTIIDELSKAENQRNSYWRKIGFHSGGRPANPPTLPRTRYGDLYVRLYLR